MGVYATDRATGAVFGASSQLWDLLGQALQALGGFGPDPESGIAGAPGTSVVPWPREGFLPARVAQRFGRLLFDGLGTLVVTCRPEAGSSTDLVPISVGVAGSEPVLAQRRLGEQLSAYDSDLAQPALAFATFCTASTGLVVTTLRPPAPGDAPSLVAVRRRLARSGMLTHRIGPTTRSSR